MKRTASAVWSGNLKEGKGTLTAQSGILKETPYSFRSRFGDGVETNPEELIAAAHAGCFTMALSAALGQAGITPDRLSTKATLSLDQVEGGWAISAVHLDLTGKAPGIDQAKFEEVAAGAKANCPVSKVLNAKITLTATLEG
ncbi:MAG TPA: OsmC family protein [Chthoniobacteraceae bacterium]|jgi:osmotically inducible protein OsmC|nr:OsmC family protein [Chthoniobacteraceae bacterium]